VDPTQKADGEHPQRLPAVRAPYVEHGVVQVLDSGRVALAPTSNEDELGATCARGPRLPAK
jgi:hypothetical protein